MLFGERAISKSNHVVVSEVYTVFLFCQRDELMEQERASFVQRQRKWEEESKTMNEDLNALKKRVIKLVR